MGNMGISEHFDFIVVGSGAGSMCAALKMRAVGKTVLVLEKTDLVGGTTAISGGVMWIPNNRYLQAAGIHDSREDALTYLDAIIGDSSDLPGASRERRETYVDKAPATLEFLITQGLRFRRIPHWPDYYEAPGEVQEGRTVVSELFDLNLLGKDWKAKLRPGFIPIPAYLEEAMQLPNMKRSKTARKTLLKVIGRTLWSRLRGKHLVTAGQALQAQLLHKAVNSGVDVRVNASVSKLILDNDRVSGVVVNDQEIHAELGVLINAGGFSHNDEMLKQYAAPVTADWSNAISGDTGEMIREGMRIGAAVAQMDKVLGSPISLPPEAPAMKPPMQGDLSKPHTILVDQSGQRFMRESSSYMALTNGILARNKVAPALPSWMILDSQYLGKYMLAGTMPNKKKIKNWIEKGFLLCADSLHLLAQNCGMEASTLAATVERFNTFVDNGRDEDFGRGDHVYSRWLGDALHSPNETLGKIEQGPFYAVRIYPGDLGTFGGLLTDSHARVLRSDGKAIDGLYATGTSTASVMADIAPGAGGSIGPAITWAYVAAQHALKSATADN